MSDIPLLKTYSFFPVSSVPYETSDDIPQTDDRMHKLQDRAVKALELAIHIKDFDYNIYLCSEAHLGRTYFLNNFLKPYAEKAESPADLLYVNNFDDTDKPLLLSLPAGMGKNFKNDFLKVVQDISLETGASFEAEDYIQKRSQLLDKFNNEKSSCVKQMNKLAAEKGFTLDYDEKNSITLFPLLDGKKLNEEEFEKLDAELQEDYKKRSDELLGEVSVLVRRVSKAETDQKEAERSLDKVVITKVLTRIFDPFVRVCMCGIRDSRSCDEDKKKYADKLELYFDRVREDMLENFDIFLPKVEHDNNDPHLMMHDNSELYRYEVNLFVDNSQTKGAPVIYEGNPTVFNVFGSIERESEMGALVTDFTLVKAGSVHKALGGYLILHVEDLLHNPMTWESLLRCLRARKSQINEYADQNDAVRTKSISPQAIDLDLKVILIGSIHICETLQVTDERFSKFFKITAQLSDYAENTPTNRHYWFSNIAAVIKESNLLPFSKDALAALVDYSSSLCEDSDKLSLQFPLLKNIMIEASTYAKLHNQDKVTAEIFHKSTEAENYRRNYLESIYLEEYDKNIVKIETQGSSVGRVTGLSVILQGHHEFGLPHQISCTVGVGRGGIMDLEREAQLGGPIHTKAVMILKNYLTQEFAQDKPLVLTGSLCLEQSYTAIEGDSASGAELIALLSALSGVKVDHSYAMTGAVNSIGEIIAVGGVCHKIDGFFNLCNYRGLTGKQGVIIPEDNKKNLILSKKVHKAIEENKFHIYPVSHITQALQLLTGMECGIRKEDFTYPENTLFHKVNEKLKHYGWLAENSYKKEA